jgi:NAD(P)-dependent dehydrogenase (short-subunit alcohol dehydrogenase family)
MQLTLMADKQKKQRLSVVITGASSGLGRALALAFAKKVRGVEVGHTVVLTALRRKL